jgi:hypothetical protein
VISAWDSAGQADNDAAYYQAAPRDPLSYRYGPDASYFDAAATNPQGGVLVAGDLRVTDAPFQHAALMFESRDSSTQLRWGPVALDSEGLVLGVGVDVLGRSLVLTDGASRFGAGQVAAQWFERDGTPLTCAFALLTHYTAPDTSPGDRAWLEAVPLAAGGLAIRRADLAYASSYSAPMTRRYVATVASGAARFSSPPAWMTALEGATLQLVRGSQAYAVLRDGGSTAVCTQHLDLIAPDGTACGGRDYPIADGSCITFPLTVGADGTVIQRLPTSLEPTVEYPYGGFSSGCTWRWWPGALR